MQYEELVLFKISPATNHFRSGLGLDNYTFGLALVGGCDRSYLIWAGSYRLGWFRQTASGS